MLEVLAKLSKSQNEMYKLFLKIKDSPERVICEDSPACIKVTYGDYTFVIIDGNVVLHNDRTAEQTVAQFFISKTIREGLKDLVIKHYKMKEAKFFRDSVATNP